MLEENDGGICMATLDGFSGSAVLLLLFAALLIGANIPNNTLEEGSCWRWSRAVAAGEGGCGCGWRRDVAVTGGGMLLGLEEGCLRGCSWELLRGCKKPVQTLQGSRLKAQHRY